MWKCSKCAYLLNEDDSSKCAMCGMKAEDKCSQRGLIKSPEDLAIQMFGPSMSFRLKDRENVHYRAAKVHAEVKMVEDSGGYFYPLENAVKEE